MKYLFCIAVIFCLSCSRPPYSASNKLYKKQSKQLADIIKSYPLADSLSNAPFVGTTNFNLRKPNFVIIHHTAQNSCEQTLRTFTTNASQVSAHYVICKDGAIHHMLNDYMRAWHAGAGKWGNDADINSNSIGIELDNNGYETFAPEQISSLLKLLAALKKQYNIPQPNFIGHADIAPTRKTDPNIYFPWKLLAENGFGFWYDDTSNVSLPATFNHLQALRIIGYNVKDSNAAIVAFKRHWLGDSLPGLDSGKYKILLQVMKKYE